MLDERRGALLALIASVGLGGLCLGRLATRYIAPFPPVTVSFGSSEAGLHEIGGVVMGLRRLAADMAWIQTLQYYGSHEADEPEEHDEHGHTHEHDYGGGKYPRFLALCQQVTALDPYFVYAYYYGGGVLGWNLNRLSEAEELLKEGIARNPHEWRLPQYLAALAYQKNHDVGSLIKFLETIVQDPDCPLLMKALLANVYKKQHEYEKALRLWEVIYSSGDAAYMHRAIGQVQEIQKLRMAQKAHPLDRK